MESWIGSQGSFAITKAHLQFPLPLGGANRRSRKLPIKRNGWKFLHHTLRSESPEGLQTKSVKKAFHVQMLYKFEALHRRMDCATFTHQCCCATRCAPKNCTREGLGGSAILSHNTKLRNTISSIAGSTLLLHWSMASNTLAISIAINLNIIQGTLYFNHHFQSNWWSTLPPAAAHLLPLLGPLHMLKIWWDYVLHRAQILQSSPCRQCCVLRCTRKM